VANRLRSTSPAGPAGGNIVTGKILLVIGNKIKYIVAAGCETEVFSISGLAAPAQFTNGHSPNQTKSELSHEGSGAVNSFATDGLALP
jgi:hypothetical protein